METENRFSFTKRKLENIKIKGAYYDTHKDANGLIFNVQTNGSQGSFIVRGRVNNKRVVVTIGKFPNVTIEQARRKARETQADFANNINPNSKKKFERTKASTLSQFFETYLEVKNLKPKTVAGYRVSFKNVLAPLAEKEMTAIAFDDVLKVHKAYTKRSTAEADRAMRLLRAIFYMAMDEIKDLEGRPIIFENPVRKLGKNKHFTKLDRKTRKLEDDQIKPFLDHIETLTKDNRPFYQVGADLALMLFYHGTRITEAASMKWEQVDFKYKRFYLSETKNGRRLWLPMTSESEKVLKRRKKLITGSAFVFPSVTDNNKPLSDIKKPLKDLLEQTGIEITPHDLRRTFLSTGARLGFNDSLLKQLANHATGADVTSGYLIQSADELKEPSQKITNTYLDKAGRQTSDPDSQINELLSGLSDAEKQRLLIRLMNNKQTS